MPAARRGTRDRQRRNSDSRSARTVTPFFTGKQKLIDTEGRVERFMKKYGAQTVAGLKERQKQLRSDRHIDPVQLAELFSQPRYAGV